jgi:hypothetical protein
MRGTWRSLAATLAVGATVAVLSPYRAVTPGTLRPGHLAQKDNCLSCHTLLAGAPALKCAVCHRPADIGLRTVAGAAVPKPSPRTQLVHRVVSGECARCHAEHGARSGATRRFAHDLLGGEVAAGCAACHAAQRPADALHAAVTGECTPCHGTGAWKPAAYDHDRSFRFDRHHPARCADCHPPGASLKEYTCIGCHEHSLDRMVRKHREEGISSADLARCRRCHPSGDEHDTIGEGGRGEGGGRDGGKRDEDD